MSVSCDGLGSSHSRGGICPGSDEVWVVDFRLVGRRRLGSQGKQEKGEHIRGGYL